MKRIHFFFLVIIVSACSPGENSNLDKKIACQKMGEEKYKQMQKQYEETKLSNEDGVDILNHAAAYSSDLDTCAYYESNAIRRARPGSLGNEGYISGHYEKYIMDLTTNQKLNSYLVTFDYSDSNNKKLNSFGNQEELRKMFKRYFGGDGNLL